MPILKKLRTAEKTTAEESHTLGESAVVDTLSTAPSTTPNSGQSKYPPASCSNCDSAIVWTSIYDESTPHCLGCFPPPGRSLVGVKWVVNDGVAGDDGTPLDEPRPRWERLREAVFDVRRSDERTHPSRSPLRRRHIGREPGAGETIDDWWGRLAEW